MDGFKSTAYDGQLITRLAHVRTPHVSGMPHERTYVPKLTLSRTCRRRRSFRDERIRLPTAAGQCARIEHTFHGRGDVAWLLATVRIFITVNARSKAQ